MTSYNLEVTSIPPLSKNKPRQAIVLCHGYGGDGKDISVLAINWQRFLPDAIFLCPNAPEICSINPQGYQWFELSTDKEEVILEKSLVAEEKLNMFLDQVFDNLQLESSNLALVGFSQGCMLSIQVGLKRKKQINCLIGYSGKIINKEHLKNNINSKPKIFLMHGENDEIVLPTHLLDAKEYLIRHKIKVKTKLFKNCEHKIPLEGTSLGLSFLRSSFESGATFRIIVNTGDWDSSIAANSPGQSGNPDSPFYSNLYQKWANDKYFPMYYSKEKIKSVTYKRSYLTPSKTKLLLHKIYKI